MTPRVLWLGGLAALAAGACTQSYDDFDFPGTTAAAGSGGTTTTSVGGGGAGATGGTGATGGMSTGGGGGTPTGGSGGAPGGATVECGGSQCDVSGNAVCCLAADGSGTTCAAGGSCGADFAVVHCDGPTDCSSGPCCAIYDFDQNRFSELVCSSDCNSSGRLVVCTDGGQSVCPASTQCHASEHLPAPYKVCN